MSIPKMMMPVFLPVPGPGGLDDELEPDPAENRNLGTIVALVKELITHVGAMWVQSPSPMCFPFLEPSFSSR